MRHFCIYMRNGKEVNQQIPMFLHTLPEEDGNPRLQIPPEIAYRRLWNHLIQKQLSSCQPSQHYTVHTRIYYLGPHTKPKPIRKHIYQIQADSLKPGPTADAGTTDNQHDDEISVQPTSLNR